MPLIGKTHLVARTAVPQQQLMPHSLDVKRAELCSAGRPAPAERYALPDVQYRRHVPAFAEIVVRELLVNALVHQPTPSAATSS